MITANNLALAYGPYTIFHGVSFFFSDEHRVGLVGRNGSGKSTLLKIIANLQSVDGGSLTIAKGTKIAYVPQELVLESERSILDEAFQAWSDIIQLQNRIVLLEQHYDLHDVEIGQEYAQLQEAVALLNPDRAMIETKQILAGLGFLPEQLDQSVQTLSVGWKMRIVLAKQLLAKADFYLFDEPTNHLDLQTKDWFISFLKQAPFGFLLVCHERYILDQLCTQVLALEHGRATLYHGNYSTYQRAYETHIAQLYAAKALQEKEIAKKRQTIERFRASASKAKMAQSMLKELEKIEIIQVPPAPKQIHFSFPPVQKSGKIVLTFQNICHQFGNKILFQNISGEIERGQKVAIIAPNGAGKSTLLSLFQDTNRLQKGAITFGYQVLPALFEQDQSKALHGSKTILENISSSSTRSEQYIRNMLGSFLFSNDDVYKKVSVLSGGERNRVGMAKILLQEANLLLLDEPTNHLDITSKEILLHALHAYPETILFVSHDHSFINGLATHILELTATSAHMYEGTYDTYRTWKSADTATVTQPVSKSMSSATKVFIRDHQAGQKLKKLEQTITKLEQEIKRIAQTFADLTYGSGAFIQAQETLQKTEAQLRDTIKQWEDLYQ